MVGVWLARYLGPKQYGLFNFATAFVGLFAAVSGLGLQEIVVRSILHDSKKINSILGTAGFLQFCGGVLAYFLVITSIIIIRPDDSFAIAIVVILGLMLPIKVSEVAIFWFESQVNSKYTVWVQNSVLILFALIKTFLILNKSPLITFIWLTLIEGLLTGVLLLLVMNKIGPRLSHLEIGFNRAKALLKESWPLALSGIAITIYMKIDQIMLGQMVGDESVGIYSAATRISEIWYFIPLAIVSSVYPSIIESKKQSEKLYYNRLQTLFNFMFILSLSVALPMTFLSSNILLILFGEPYISGGKILAIHIWTSVFVFFGVVNGKWFLTENLQKLVFFRALSGAILNVCLNFILIPFYGGLGAAIATLLSAIFVNMLIDGLTQRTRVLFIMKLKSLNIFKSIKSLWL
jgi:PST family polysaccharide transporter